MRAGTNLLALVVRRYAQRDGASVNCRYLGDSAHGETDHGIVTDEAVRLRTVEEVKAALAEAGFTVSGVVESPITGTKGNIEYLVRATFAV